MRKVKFDVTFLILFVFAIFSICFASFLNTKIFNYYINPILWICIALYSYKYDGIYSRFKNKVSNYKSVIVFILFYIVIYFCSGLLFGYAYTPYSHTIISICKNIWRIIVPIICMEITRDICVNKNKNSKLFVVICTIIFIVLELNIDSLIISSKTSKELFENICSIVLPLIFMNVMYTYYCMKGSFKLVLFYRLPLELLFLIVPVFPNHDWFVKACFGMIMPVLFILILRRVSDERGLRTEKKRQKESLLGYIPFFGICILLVLFMVGAFKYEPVAIVSNSMVPVFSRGDVVIYEKVSDSALKNIENNSIIVYNKDGKYVVHRVIEHWLDSNEVLYLTKGDANNGDDGIPVKTNQIIGIYKLHVKFVGYPSVWLNDLFN